jgi:hypothetical protein
MPPLILVNHLIQLPRCVKNRQTGQYTTVYDDYLEVKWRLVWFWEKFPRGVISIEKVYVDLERGYTRFRGVVDDVEDDKASGYGTEMAAGFADYVERAETGGEDETCKILARGRDVLIWLELW